MRPQTRFEFKFTLSYNKAYYTGVSNTCVKAHTLTIDQIKALENRN